MALETVISLVGIDKTGRVITLRNETDWVSGGVPYPNVSSYIFTVSAYASDSLSSQRYVRAPDPIHPEYLTTPSVDNISNKTPVQITSITLGITAFNKGLKGFSDGIIDINMYAVMQEITGVTANEGDFYITGSGLDYAWGLDALVIDNDVYQIDHSKPTNGGNIIYIIGSLKQSSTSFYPAYRANIKVLNDKFTQCGIDATVGRISCISDCLQRKRFVDTISDAQNYLDASYHFFDCSDFAKANDLLVAAESTLKFNNCGCK